MHKNERTLWLAVLARAIADLLESELTASGDFDEEDLDNAVAYVLRYPRVAERIRKTRSKPEMQQWLKEIEDTLENLDVR